jgi:hypothetical protein
MYFVAKNTLKNINHRNSKHPQSKFHFEILDDNIFY